MPAIRSSKDAVEGGLRGITKFLAGSGMVSFEEDLEGKFGTQVQFKWDGVEVVE